MRRILVPLDGSQLAERALEPALRLAARHRADVHLASVVSDLPPGVAMGLDAVATVGNWLDEEEKRTWKYVTEVRDRLAPKWSHMLETHVALGRVAPKLMELGADLGIDLIVLTTHGRGAWDRFWLGSIADQLVRTSTIPLLLLRGGEDSERIFARDTSPNHVFVPLDGSKAAEAVFGILSHVLPRVGGRVTSMSVAQRSLVPFAVYLPDAKLEQTLFEENKRKLQAYLSGARGKLEGAGAHTVNPRVVEGLDVARTLLEACQGSDADLIALATEGHGAVARLLVGGVADKVIRGSELPVLVARRREGEV